MVFIPLVLLTVTALTPLRAVLMMKVRLPIQVSLGNRKLLQKKTHIGVLAFRAQQQVLESSFCGCPGKGLHGRSALGADTGSGGADAARRGARQRGRLGQRGDAAQRGA